MRSAHTAFEVTDTIRVLHVEDESQWADLTKTYLERENDQFSVDTAADSEAGLAKLAENRYDCIVSDFDMPGRNGIQFLEAVREEYPDIPFVLFTGKGSEEVASRAISAGVTDYLQKGGTDRYTILANRVRNGVERYRSKHEAEQTRTQLQAIADHSADVIIIIDTEGRIRFANTIVEEFFGYTPSELRGKQLTTLISTHLISICPRVNGRSTGQIWSFTGSTRTERKSLFQSRTASSSRTGIGGLSASCGTYPSADSCEHRPENANSGSNTWRRTSEKSFGCQILIRRIYST